MEFISDSPLQDPKQDQLGRWNFSKRIARTIVAREDPSSLVIGIHGPWGAGKTTVINFIAKVLNRDEENHVVSFRFNPWRTEEEDELILSFFQALVSALDRSLQSDVERFGEYLSEYAKALKPLRLDSTFEAAGDAIGGPTLEELKSRVGQALEEENKRLVVFMDDIDRMDKGGIQNVFRLIKLTADFENVVYVLAFDRNLVADALHEKYPSEEGRSGYSFLEKIVQVPLDLPAPRSEPLRQMCFVGIQEALNIADIELSDAEVQEFGRRFGRGLAPAIETPRMAKRYTNILSFALPILEGEVHPVDQILIEGIRVLYPKVYSHIRSHRDLYLRGLSRDHIFDSSDGDEQEKKIQEVLSDLSDLEQDSLRWLLGELFPNAGSSSASKESLTEEQRVASPKYFDRYFSYSLSDQELSDVELENFIGELKQVNGKDPSEILGVFVDFLSIGSTGTLIEKLRARVELHNDKSALLLATILAMTADHFPRAQRGQIGLSPFQEAYFLIEDLLENQSPPYRRETVEEIIAKGYLPFSARAIRSVIGSDDSESLFGDADNEYFLDKLVSRIEEEAEKQSLIDQYSGEVPAILHRWKEARGKEELSNHLEQSLDENPDEALDLLLGVAPTVKSSSGHRTAPFPGNFERRHYDPLKEFANPSVIYSALKDVLGEEVEAPLEYTDRLSSDDPDRVRIAKQFAAIHHHVESKENEEANSDPNDSDQSERPTDNGDS
jgi:hypothetical protein